MRVCDGGAEGGLGGEGHAGRVVLGGREECEGEGERAEGGDVCVERGGERRDGEGEGERGGHLAGGACSCGSDDQSR